MTETNTIASAVQPLVARTVVCAPDGELLDRLTPDGFAWLRNGTGFVTGGVAARVAAAAADPVLRAITAHNDVGLPGR